MSFPHDCDKKSSSALQFNTEVTEGTEDSICFLQIKLLEEVHSGQFI